MSAHPLRPMQGFDCNFRPHDITMPTTLDKTRSPSRPPSDQPIGECVLRVCSGEHQGKIVRLKHSKCTIGAGPDCTLRLVAPGLKPLHCVLIAGPQGVAIRRWSEGTLLNGRTFDNAWLETGDQLRVGPVELEWIGWEKPLVLAERFDAAETRQRETTSKPTEADPAEPKKEARRQRARSLKQYKRLLRAKSRMIVLRRRAKKADRTIEKLNRKLGDLRGQMATLTSSSEGISNHHAETIRRLDEELRQQRQDRRTAESQFEAQSRTWNEERRRLETALDSIGRQLSAEQETATKWRTTADQARGLTDQTAQQLRQAAEGLAAKQAEWKQAIRDLEAARDQATSLRNQLEQLQREIASQKEAHRHQREENAATLRDQTAALRDQLDQLQREMAAQTESHRRQQNESATTLRDQTRTLRNQLDQLHGEMAAQTESHRRQQGESAATLRDQTAALRDQLDLLQREMASQTDSHRLQQGESAATLAQYAAELKELRGWWHEFTAEAAKASENVSVTKTQWDSLSHQCDRLTEAKRSVEQSLATTQASLEGANQRVAELTAHIEALERVSDAVKDDLQREHESALQAESALAELQARYSHLAAQGEAERQAWSREREASETELTTTQAAINRLRVEWQTQKSLVDTGNARVAALESEAQSLREQIEGLERQSQVAAEELTRSQEHARQVETALAELQTRHGMLLASGDSDRQALTREQEQVVGELSSARSELERLRNEYQAQKLLVDVANTRIAQLEDESRSLKGKVESLQHEAQVAREEVERCRQAQQQAEASLGELQARYQQLQSAREEDRQAWDRQREKLEGELVACKAELDRAVSEREAQKGALADAQARVAQLENESHSLKGHAESLESLGHSVREEIQRCQEAQRQAESALAEQLARYAQLQATSEADRQTWNGQRERLEGELAAATSETNRLHGECQSQKSLVDAANAHIARLESDARARQIALSEASNDAAAAAQLELEQVRQSLRTAEQERDRTLAGEQSLKRQLDEASGQLSALQGQVESWKGQTEQGTQQTQAQREQLDSLQRCRESLDQRVVDLTQEIDQARSHLESVASEKSELATLCDQLRTELLRQKSEAEAAAAQWNDERTRYQRELEAGRGQAAVPETPALISDDSWQRRELEQLQKSLAGEREDLEYERTRWKETKDAWETKLKQRSEELDRWQADLHDSQQLLASGGPGIALPQSSPHQGASGNENMAGAQDRPAEKAAYENPLFENPLFQDIAPEVDRRMGLNRGPRPDEGFSPVDDVPSPETPAGDSPVAMDSPSGDVPSDHLGGQDSNQDQGGQEEPSARQNQTMVFDRSSVRVPVEQAKAAQDENADDGNDVWQRLNQAGLLRAPEQKPESAFGSGDSFLQSQDPSTHDGSSAGQSNAFPFGSQAGAGSPAQPSAQSAPFQPKLPAEDEEESIEDYMARLLKRVRGESTGGHGAVASVPVAAKPAAPQPVATPSADGESEPEEASPEPNPAPMGTVSAEEYVPKCQAPESHINMAAMRELAINSARTALAASADQRRRKTKALSVAGLIGCVVGAAAIGGASFVMERYDLAATVVAPCAGAIYFAMKLFPSRRR